MVRLKRWIVSKAAGNGSVFQALSSFNVRLLNPVAVAIEHEYIGRPSDQGPIKTSGDHLR
jgi:hypothetical protein